MRKSRIKEMYLHTIMQLSFWSKSSYNIITTGWISDWRRLKYGNLTFVPSWSENIAGTLLRREVRELGLSRPSTKIFNLWNILFCKWKIHHHTKPSSHTATNISYWRVMLKEFINRTNKIKGLEETAFRSLL